MNTNASSKFGLYFVLMLLLFEKCRSADSNSVLMEKVYAELMKEKHPFNLGNISNFETEMRIVMKELMNSTLPVLVDIVNAASVSNDCTKSLIKYAFDLINVRSWAMRMLDATSKLPSGILEGTLSELGLRPMSDIELPYKNGSSSFKTVLWTGNQSNPSPFAGKFNVGIKARRNL
ncbi:nose resistant to fluoxetine protein 6 [Trichonephila clavata]|uniref:Nose resistant to fluoxetine protein 6 n=1 Tax=Trichonephila clavata TaxID=2740835 RepID=A0A8X6GHK1_TRICU|nr:nose resistant to fluoxetine protein 6 [Trichonephila clavata]